VNDRDPMETPAAETQRIIRSGTIWVTAALLTPSIGLGPLLASGWRPSALPEWAQILFWIGAAAAALGTASLIWAGCPTLGFPLRIAYRQKQICIRSGIVLDAGGMALVGVVLLLTPA
jgi:hypothetical protein